jgi:hypothetical protein
MSGCRSCSRTAQEKSARGEAARLDLFRGAEAEVSTPEIRIWPQAMSICAARRGLSAPVNLASSPANHPMFPLSGGGCRLLGYNVVISNVRRNWWCNRGNFVGYKLHP